MKIYIVIEQEHGYPSNLLVCFDHYDKALDFINAYSKSPDRGYSIKPIEIEREVSKALLTLKNNLNV